MAEPASTLIVGNGDLEAVQASLGALATPPNRAWCAVSTTEEADVAQGLANVKLMVPWPGSRSALARLQADATPSLPGDAIVIILGAGTVPQRNFVSHASVMLRAGAAVVMATDSESPADSWGILGRLTSSVLAHAVLPPTSGLVMEAETLARLTAAGWLEGRELRLSDVRQIAGPVRVLRGAVSSYRPPRRDRPETSRRRTVTVLIPAHNEEAWIGETLRSIRVQSVQPDEVIVVDDCSTDRTGDIARHHGATVLRTPTNRLKAGAQNHGLAKVRTDVVVTLDADTVLHPRAIEHLLTDLNADCDATNGAVMPQSRRGIWTRARLIEYAIAMRLHKRAQRYLGVIVVLSGCVSAFHTDVLRRIGGFQERTITEDLDMTWALHVAGYRVGYAPAALSYPVEPTSWALYKAQMRRWAGGMFQTIGAHGKALLRKPGLVFILVASLWDLMTSVGLLVLAVVLLATGVSEVTAVVVLIALGLTILAPLVLASTVVGLRPAAAAMPAYLLGALASQYFYLEAFVREWILRRRRRTWAKGH